jgi:hypothetical protein
MIIVSDSGVTRRTIESSNCSTVLFHCTVLVVGAVAKVDCNLRSRFEVLRSQKTADRSRVVDGPERTVLPPTPGLSAEAGER